MFQTLFDHEVMVSKSINDLVHITLQEKDYATHNFLQWYVSEQIEEEAFESEDLKEAASANSFNDFSSISTIITFWLFGISPLTLK